MRVDLLFGQQIPMCLAVYECGHLRGTPLRKLRYILQWKTKHIRHNHLRQRASELRNELHLTIIDPLVDQLIGTARDHFGVTAGARSNPGIGQLLAVRPVQLVRGSQRHHRGHHRVDLRGVIHCIAGLRQLCSKRCQRRWESHRIADDQRDVFVLRQNESVSARHRAFAGQAQHRRFAMQDRIRLVPMLLRARREQIYVSEGDRTFHRTTLVIGMLLDHARLAFWLFARAYHTAAQTHHAQRFGSTSAAFTPWPSYRIGAAIHTDRFAGDVAGLIGR